jgi:dTDP-4-dehydrorhamnose 3,5-epimerase
MRFTETELAGAFVVDLEPHRDERGFFARAFDAAEFERRGLSGAVAQVSLSHNDRRGTLRGMHFAAPQGETKLVRCVRGAMHDVIVDVRPGSATRGRHVAVELSAGNRRALYVPEGFAHGFQTLADDTEVLYQIAQYHTPGSERGLRFDDPALGIEWPLPVTVISARDRAWPSLDDGAGARG